MTREEWKERSKQMLNEIYLNAWESKSNKEWAAIKSSPKLIAFEKAAHDHTHK